MSDYSALDKFLHRLTLGSRTLSKTLFDIDDMLVGVEVDLTQTVYVLGFARCGTTALTEGLYQTKEFASLTYSDMPFVMAPNLWSKISNFQNRRIYK